jgi:hypothetical protein
MITMVGFVQGSAGGHSSTEVEPVPDAIVLDRLPAILLRIVGI